MADFTGTSGNDVQNGTAADETFDYSQGGRDTLNGLSGDDTFYMGATLTNADRIDGGALFADVVVLEGDYANLVLGPATLVNLEGLRFNGGHDYKVTIDDAMAEENPNAPFTVEAFTLGPDDVLQFHGAAETSTNFFVSCGKGDDIASAGGGEDFLFGGAGDDRLSGGLADDHIYGGNGGDTLRGNKGEDIIDAGAGADVLLGDRGSDQMYGGGGKDTLNGGEGGDALEGNGGRDILIGGGTGFDRFAFNAVSDSTGRACDWIQDWNSANDAISGAGASGVDGIIEAGVLDDAAFNAGLEDSVDGAHLAADHAVIFTPDGGDLAGHAYLIIDANGIAGYQAREDYVVEMTGGAGLESFGIGNFI